MIVEFEKEIKYEPKLKYIQPRKKERKKERNKETNKQTKTVLWAPRMVKQSKASIFVLDQEGVKDSFWVLFRA